ncbi:MAG: D-alanine--D-alanine ligase [Fretibacterium sp.]|nr:D-alanine--D-alanine ligase [Fretibacterium sp.]
MAIRVGVFFGGKSVEHEVSIISALQALPFFDRGKYDPVPVYMTKEGHMYVGDLIGKIEEYQDVPALLSRSRRVVGVREEERFFLMRYPFRRFGSSVHCELDVAFPIVHGTNVEDGALQGYFRTMGLPFVGPDVAASALGMEKGFMKSILRDAGLPVLDCRHAYVRDFFRDPDGTVRDIEAAFPYPLVVKPVNLGSSIGISRAEDALELRGALEHAFQYAQNALVEPAVANLREVNCAVLGDQESILASECEEPLTTHAILNYEDKYAQGPAKGKSFGVGGMSSARRKLPADLPHEVREQVRSLAQRTFRALGCNGVARVDFLMDASDGTLWVNEINTIPGSLSFYLWEPVGLSYKELIDRLIELALKREREKAGVSYSFETNILANLSRYGGKGKS